MSQLNFYQWYIINKYLHCFHDQQLIGVQQLFGWSDERGNSRTTFFSTQIFYSWFRVKSKKNILWKIAATVTSRLYVFFFRLHWLVKWQLALNGDCLLNKYTPRWRWRQLKNQREHVKIQTKKEVFETIVNILFAIAIRSIFLRFICNKTKFEIIDYQILTPLSIKEINSIHCKNSLKNHFYLNSKMP